MLHTLTLTLSDFMGEGNAVVRLPEHVPLSHLRERVRARA
jgi:hypothetical protein